MNLFELDIDDSFDFYCPVTGSQILGPDPSPVFVPVLMRELGISPRGVSEGGA
jgi:hypothetical protein